MHEIQFVTARVGRTGASRLLSMSVDGNRLYASTLGVTLAHCSGDPVAAVAAGSAAASAKGYGQDAFFLILTTLGTYEVYVPFDVALLDEERENAAAVLGLDVEGVRS